MQKNKRIIFVAFSVLYFPNIPKVLKFFLSLHPHIFLKDAECVFGCLVKRLYAFLWVGSFSRERCNSMDNGLKSPVSFTIYLPIFTFSKNCRAQLIGIFTFDGKAITCYSSLTESKRNGD